jgi:hypothetical protein
MLLVSFERGHLQPAFLERPNILEVLRCGLRVIRLPQIRGRYPGVEGFRDAPDDGLSEHRRILRQRLGNGDATLGASPIS